MIEIERKFLVNSNDFIKEACSNHEISQGYLNTNPERTVRVRIKGKEGYLTIKGVGNDTGLSRFEWEKQINVDEAKQLLLLCERGVISKIRYNIEVGKHIFEVDVFSGENKGLIIAEIELESENESFEKPIWLGQEVTNDERYYNAYLSQKPFLSW
jgi:adenylate cyclase